jgi:hypothetical protein
MYGEFVGGPMGAAFDEPIAYGSQTGGGVTDAPAAGGVTE